MLDWLGNRKCFFFFKHKTMKRDKQKFIHENFEISEFRFK